MRVKLLVDAELDDAAVSKEVAASSLPYVQTARQWTADRAKKAIREMPAVKRVEVVWIPDLLEPQS